jgi:hypothetical protein
VILKYAAIRKRWEAFFLAIGERWDLKADDNRSRSLTLRPRPQAIEATKARPARTSLPAVVRFPRNFSGLFAFENSPSGGSLSWH